MQFRRPASDPAERSCTDPITQAAGASTAASIAGVIRVQPADFMRRWSLIANRRMLFLLFALFSILFLTVSLGSAPIQLWDESRLAVNAMEMHLRGLSLVTTYDFSPDQWNTKPPLLIWLMNLTMSAIGPSKFALRLPSAIAAAGTVCITVYFCWRVTQSVVWSLSAGALLLSAKLFMGKHAAATADYDALLTFFTTGYLAILFFVLIQEKPKSLFD
jgi:4-amino-4-deoxy-L-arabinose transferase-like glycosyltransferase